MAAGDSKTAITLYEASLGFGIACGPLIGGLLGAQSWRLPFVGTSVLMIIAFGFVVATVPEPEAERQQGVRDVVGAFRHTGVLTNAIIGLLYTFGFFTVLAYTPLILGLPPLQLGIVFFAWGLLVVVGSVVLSSRLNRRFGTPEVTAGALAVFSWILCLMWLSSEGSGTLTGLVVASGVFCGLLNANLTTFAMGISSHGRSVASGAFNSLRFIGGAFAPIMAGYLGQQYGATIPYLLGTLAVVIGLVVLLVRFEGFGGSEPEPAPGD